MRWRRIGMLMQFGIRSTAASAAHPSMFSFALHHEDKGRVVAASNRSSASRRALSVGSILKPPNRSWKVRASPPPGFTT